MPPFGEIVAAFTQRGKMRDCQIGFRDPVQSSLGHDAPPIVAKVADDERPHCGLGQQQLPWDLPNWRLHERGCATHGVIIHLVPIGSHPFV